MVKYFFSLLCLMLWSCVYNDLSVEVPQPEAPQQPQCDSTVSWHLDILPLMTTACATSGCHDGITRRDWTDYDEVKQYAAAIKKRVRDKSMPFDGPLPQDQIDMISCWVDQGAMKN